jgi:hypothetical protein
MTIAPTVKLLDEHSLYRRASGNLQDIRDE